MIDGVSVIPLSKIVDERGMIMHMLRCDSPHFDKIGEVYFSVAYPGVIKAWHLHKEMILNYAVISGMAKLVLYDSRQGSPTKGEVQELFIGEDNYVLVKIPPMVYNGYKCIGTKSVILANCPTLPHDPNELVRVDPFINDIPYNWEIKNC